MAAPTLRDWLGESPFSLTMSSGFFGFFAHAGVLGVLESEGLIPKRVSGSSAGALVTGLWSAGLPAARIGEELLALEREQFWDPRPGLGLLRGKLFREKLEAMLPVATFEQARVPAAVSVFDMIARRTRIRGHGPIAPALVASCAVPFLFHPVWLDGRPYADGGILDRPGLAGMPAGERVLYHHLSSRSPWRRRGSPALQVPERNGLVGLVLDGLPRANPFKLDAGRRAFHAAAESTRRALELPVQDGGVVRLAVA